MTSLTFACAAFSPCINPFLTLHIWSGFCFPDQPPSEPQGQGKKGSILDLIILIWGVGLKDHFDPIATVILTLLISSLNLV